MLCLLADDRNPQLEEIVSNFEITNKTNFQRCWTNVQT